MPQHRNHAHRKLKVRLDTALPILIHPIRTYALHILKEEVAQLRLLIVLDALVVRLLVELVLELFFEGLWRVALYAAEEFGS